MDKGRLPVFDFGKLVSESDYKAHIQWETCKNVQNKGSISTRNPNSSLKEDVNEVKNRIWQV